MDERYKSDIPPNAVEQLVSEYKQKDGAAWPEKRVYTVDGVIVGYRHYEADGSLCMETPIKNGKKHGTEYSWERGEDGPILSLSEPYENGLVHGTATQWASDGSLMGTYTLSQGCGYDIWRQYDDQGQLYVAEIHTYKDGYPHGFEWWLDDDQTLSSETHYFPQKGIHGIERHWNSDGDLDPDYPKFYIDNTIVDKSTYLKQQKHDPDLPEYAEADDRNVRKFPDDVIAAIKAG